MLLHFFDYMLQKLSACYLPLIGTPSLSSIGIHLSASLRITNNHSPVRVACLKSTSEEDASSGIFPISMIGLGDNSIGLHTKPGRQARQALFLFAKWGHHLIRHGKITFLLRKLFNFVDISIFLLQSNS